MKIGIKPTLAALVLSVSAPALSYEIGDVISDKVLEKLNLPAGKPVVLDFFASWCLSCAKEIPDLRKFIREDAKDRVEVIGVDVDEELEDGLEFQNSLDIDFAVVNDTDQVVIEAFAPIGMPAIYYVVDNKVVGKRIGAVNHIDKQIIEDLKGVGVELE